MSSTKKTAGSTSAIAKAFSMQITPANDLKTGYDEIEIPPTSQPPTNLVPADDPPSYQPGDAANYLK